MLLIERAAPHQIDQAGLEALETSAGGGAAGRELEVAEAELVDGGGALVDDPPSGRDEATA